MSFGGRKEEGIEYEVIKNADFYSNIDVGDFQKKARINTEYRIETIKNRLVLALVYVNGEIKDKKSEWIEQGFDDLSEVSDEEINKQNTHEIHYENAVYSHAKAYLMQDYATMNRRDEAENEGKEGTFDTYMADCHDSIKWLNTESQGSLNVYSLDGIETNDCDD